MLFPLISSLGCFPRSLLHFFLFSHSNFFTVPFSFLPLSPIPSTYLQFLSGDISSSILCLYPEGYRHNPSPKHENRLFLIAPVQCFIFNVSILEVAHTVSITLEKCLCTNMYILTQLFLPQS